MQNCAVIILRSVHRQETKKNTQKKQLKNDQSPTCIHCARRPPPPAPAAAATSSIIRRRRRHRSRTNQRWRRRQVRINIRASLAEGIVAMAMVVVVLVVDRWSSESSGCRWEIGRFLTVFFVCFFLFLGGGPSGGLLQRNSALVSARHENRLIRVFFLAMAAVADYCNANLH